MPARIVTLVRYAVALALTLSATAALAMNPALLKRQIEAGDAGMGSNIYMRLITADDWSANQEENRLEVVIEIPANASIEGRMIEQPNERCEITPNAKAVSNDEESRGRFYAAAQAQPWHLAVRAQPLSACDPNVLRAVLIAKDHAEHTSAR